MVFPAIGFLTTAIATREAALRATIPSDREAALVALVHAQDRLLSGLDLTQEPPNDLIHGSRLANSGGSLAFGLVLDAAPEARSGSAHLTNHHRAQPDIQTDHWAEGFLVACGSLIDARHVLAHLATGFMRGEVQPDGSIAAWIAQKRYPPTWRERIDLAWWSAHAHRPTTDDPVQAMDWQFSYLPDAIIESIPAHIWTEAVRTLVSHIDVNAPSIPIPKQSILHHLADTLTVAPDVAEGILSALTLDAANATWHAAVPGIAAAPLVRLSPETLIPSRFGLRTQPLLFAARELRRRDAQNWHNAAHQRETAFRQDLAGIFADKRFVHAPTRIQLKREGGTLRTDIDAAIFDRKTGTLALFEVKAQDPFSRSPEELERRRDSLLSANRQLSGILDWTKRHNPDEILDRIDHQTAKRFHVQRVLPFVLARTLVHFEDGPQPDKRAAWGTWPDVLRLNDAGTLDPAGGNPLQTLFTRIHGWRGDPPLPPATPPRVIRLETVAIVVTPTRPAQN
ncbi:MAG: hypothetical protein QM589_00630 [Thermomicrobiales bacterium]